MSRERFECSPCGFTATDRDEFDTFDGAMACPECQSLRVEHVFTEDGDDDLVADGGVSWYDLHGFRRDILRVVAEIDADGERSYGLAIRDRLEARYGETVNHGRLYPNLNGLVDAGLLEKSELDKRTNSYTLTDAGTTMLREQQAAWEDLTIPNAVAMADGGAE